MTFQSEKYKGGICLWEEEAAAQEGIQEGLEDLAEGEAAAFPAIVHQEGIGEAVLIDLPERQDHSDLPGRGEEW